MTKYNLTLKGKNFFIYERHNEEFDYDKIIEISFKNIQNGYRGVQVISYQKECNTDGFNNAVGLRKNELLMLPFMIMHFIIYRIFIKVRRIKNETMGNQGRSEYECKSY